MAGDVARRVAARYPTRFLRSYVRWKVSTDPVYGAVFDRLRRDAQPVLDVGCGVGVLGAYLRERGLHVPIIGVDHDAAKIGVARGLGLAGATFEAGDARASLDHDGAIVMLDVLHYFRDQEQAEMLRQAAERAQLVIIRDALRDGTWRHRLTHAQEWFSRAVHWLKAERLNFPTRQTIDAAFPRFDAEVVPMWGRTPFNNYLFVLRRSSAGMTKV